MRLRFAPSPTGALHIGGARTALYNWLLARGAEQGTLVLRIEDTDRERSTQENVDQILDALEWLGIDYDEGPISQVSRSERHQEMLQRLLDSGRAYRTTAGKPEVDAYKAANGAGRGFRGQDEGQGAVRLRIPDEGETAFDDVVLGRIAVPNHAIDDPVIARADQSVLYNFAVAIDDLDSGITHVVRGQDHISNTAKQLQVLEALGQEPPTYGHIPLLHGPDGKKLSKRHGAASVQELREKGYLREAVINYIALLGWGIDPDRTFYGVEELKQRFTLERVSKNPAVFDEQKLRHINGHYVRELAPQELAERLAQLDGHGRSADELLPAVVIAQEKMSTLDEFRRLMGWLYEGPADDPKARRKVLGSADAPRALQAAREALANAPEWTVDGVQAALDRTVEELEVKKTAVFQPLRVALTGTTVSPGIYETIAVAGRDLTLRRIEDTLANLPANG